MTLESRHIKFANGCDRSYGENKVDRFIQIGYS